MSSVVCFLNRALDKATTLALWLASVALVACCVLIASEVVLRNAFDATTGLSVEYSIYLLVFLVFAGLAEAQRSGAMIYMEITYDRFPPKVRSFLNALRWSLGLAYGTAATWYLFHFASRTCDLEQVSMFPSRTPLCIPQFVMVLGVALLTLIWLRGAIVGWYDFFTHEQSPGGDAPAE